MTEVEEESRKERFSVENTQVGSMVFGAQHGTKGASRGVGAIQSFGHQTFTLCNR